METKQLVDDVIHEMKELEKLDVSVPKACYDKKKIETFFVDFPGGSRELSEWIDSFIVCNI